MKYFDGEVHEIQPLPLSRATHLPISVVRYVDRTGDLVILDTVNRDRFAHDLYLSEYQPASFLCAPIFNRGELTAILYLENSLTARAFVGDRVELLNAPLHPSGYFPGKCPSLSASSRSCQTA